MQYVLSIIMRNNPAEIFDDENIGKESYTFMGLHAAMTEGAKRMNSNANIVRINVYEVFDGVKSISATGRYQLVHCLLREGEPLPDAK